MRLAHDISNYLKGTGRLYFKPVSGLGFIDFGSLTKVDLTPSITTEKHYNRRSGTARLDQNNVKEAGCTIGFSTEESCADNVRIAFGGDAVHASSQTAGNVDGVSVTVALDLFVDLGKLNLSSVKLTHGSVTGGAFVVGDVITLGTAHGTAKWIGSGFVELNDVTGVFASTGTISSSGKSATLASAEVQKDIIVTDHATVPTKRYVAGTDYEVDCEMGFFRAFTAGTITATAFTSYDYPLVTKETVRALTNTSIIGELRFVGDPDDGPHYIVSMWKVSLTASTGLGLIGESNSEIALTGEILDDTLNHPSTPFFDAVRIK